MPLTAVGWVRPGLGARNLVEAARRHGEALTQVGLDRLPHNRLVQVMQQSLNGRHGKKGHFSDGCQGTGCRDRVGCKGGSKPGQVACVNRARLSRDAVFSHRSTKQQHGDASQDFGVPERVKSVETIGG